MLSDDKQAQRVRRDALAVRLRRVPPRRPRGRRRVGRVRRVGPVRQLRRRRHPDLGQRPALRRSGLLRPVRHDLLRRRAGATARPGPGTRRRGGGDPRLQGRRARGDPAADPARARRRATPATAPAPSPAPSRAPARCATAPAWSPATRARSASPSPAASARASGRSSTRSAPSAGAPAASPRRARSTSASRPGWPTASGSGWPAGASRASAAARRATSTSWSGCATDDLFGRSGDDLTLTVPITFAEAVFGTDLRVPTMDGYVTLRVPPGTPSGRVLRARGRGVRKRDGQDGDLLVTVDVVVPTAMTDEAREALEKFAALSPDAGRDASDGTGGDPRGRRDHHLDRAVVGRQGADHLGGGAAGRHAPADAAPVRPARARAARPGRGRRAPVQRPRRGVAARGAAAEPGATASTWPASSGSSSLEQLADELQRPGGRAGGGAGGGVPPDRGAGGRRPYLRRDLVPTGRASTALVVWRRVARPIG